MDCPNEQMAALVQSSLFMSNSPEAIAFLVRQQVPDRVIARLFCKAATPTDRRRASNTELPP
jgi:hypothetical protein